VFICAFLYIEIENEWTLKKLLSYDGRSLDMTDPPSKENHRASEETSTTVGTERRPSYHSRNTCDNSRVFRDFFQSFQ
jgi:hypothetical protein